MLRCLFIQQLYSLPDEQLERELAFRERLADSGVDTEIWYALQKQLDAMKLKVNTGIMQDASFITSDPGHAKSGTPREEKAKTRRIKDENWAKKETKPCFGHKLHGAMNEDFGLICRIEVTTAKVHDSQADLANEGEVRYVDKGLFRCEDKKV